MVPVYCSHHPRVFSASVPRWLSLNPSSDQSSGHSNSRQRVDSATPHGEEALITEPEIVSSILQHGWGQGFSHINTVYVQKPNQWRCAHDPAAWVTATARIPTFRPLGNSIVLDSLSVVKPGSGAFSAH